MSVHARTALDAARAAATIARDYYRSNLAITTKADRTPVTQADVECEQAIKAVILERFPDHGFYGEETGSDRLDAEHVWLVDPIDGTKSFVREYPFFSTQIALMRGGRLVLGVSSAPAFEEIAWAEAGAGAWLNDAPITVSAIDRLEDCALSTGNIGTLARSAGWARFGAVVSTVDRIRGYGDFYHYHLLASGRIDAVVESDVNVLDIAALSVIVTEAGGVFTDLDGRPVGLDTTSVLAANGPLHAALLPVFASTG
ncbi:MAG: inositol monophosphatase family protein [Pseudomonadota bacterium]